MKKTPLKRKTPLKAKTGLVRRPKPKNVRKGQKRANKSKSMAHLKKKLDAVFSKYVRSIHPAICYTCKKPSDKLQCGHFVSRQYLATRWDLDNCRPQCVGCNIWGHGQLLDFEENLKKELGEAKVEEMKAKRHQTTILSTEWYEEQIAYYTNLL